MRITLVACALVTLLATPAPAHASDTCSDLDWTTFHPAFHKQMVKPQDLVRLRDVGPIDDDVPPHHLFAISPDRSSVAFQVRRADPATNSYCLAMVVLPLSGRTPPVFADRGGDLIRGEAENGAEPVRTTGVPAIITPRWSPDGLSFAFLKREAGVTQVWRADASGSGSRPITHFDDDVLDFRLAGPSRLIVKVRSGGEEAQRVRVAEARVGFHFDNRFTPFQSEVPSIGSPSSQRLLAVDEISGRVSSATPSDSALFDDSRAGAAQTSDGRAGARSCDVTPLPTAAGVPPATRLALRCAGRAITLCPQAACTDTSGPIWSVRAGTAFRFMRREGWARTRTAVYEWLPSSGAVRRLYVTAAFLIDCQPASEDQLVCLRETSLLPRHFANIDLASGTMMTIANLNPEFDGLTLGRVQRLLLTSDAGIRAFGDVVFPVNYRSGQRYPLIVVQYQSRGFLRGGTGDEFPIQAFANLGYAILSIQRPMPVGTLARPKNYVEVDRIGLHHFADRRSVLSVITQGVQELIHEGVVDPHSVGITGLSDGSSTAQYAAVNTRLFSAGIVSGCCWEPDQTALLGPSAAELYTDIGWPRIIDYNTRFWSHISLALNARRVAFPLLFETADDEFRLALASYTALREAGKPADLFVFPDEHHIKWQPSHRLAAYQRGIDWFQFWLRGILPEDPRRRAEARRWEMMRSEPAMSPVDERGGADVPMSHPRLGVQQ